MSSPLLHIISLGAGVQSSTMALMAALDELQPMPHCAIFADTKGEPKAVYQWLDWLEKQLPFPTYRVSWRGGIESETFKTRVSRKNGHIYWKNFVPTYSLIDGKKTMMPRKCTTDFKIIPITKKLREIAKIPRGCKEIRAIQWIGISLDEAHRMKPNRELWIRNIWPLIYKKKMTRDGCLRWMKDRGFPTPPRSACLFCPYHSDDEWLNLKLNDPRSFGRAIAFEIKAQEQAQKAGILQTEFLHRSRVPLDQVDFKSNSDQVNQFGNECEGICGV